MQRILSPPWNTRWVRFRGDAVLIALVMAWGAIRLWPELNHDSIWDYDESFHQVVTRHTFEHPLSPSLRRPGSPGDDRSLLGCSHVAHQASGCILDRCIDDAPRRPRSTCVSLGRLLESAVCRARGVLGCSTPGGSTVGDAVIGRLPCSPFGLGSHPDPVRRRRARCAIMWLVVRVDAGPLFHGEATLPGLGSVLWRFHGRRLLGQVCIGVDAVRCGDVSLGTVRSSLV